MLIVAGPITIRDDRREQFLAAVRPMVAATRAEPGCREYASRPDADIEKYTISVVGSVR
jgi:quinol monooxygenase YgiN